jgi:hypothetical protein
MRLRLLGAIPAAAVLIGCGTSGPTPSPSPSPAVAAAAEASCGVQVVWPGFGDLHAIRTQIEERAKLELLGIGEGASAVSVNLRARAECLARSIVTAYGSKVEVTVGLLPFPLKPQANGGCPIGSWPHGVMPFLKTTLDVQPMEILQGEWFRGNVRFANPGGSPANVETSSNYSAYLMQPGVETPVGYPEGGSMGTGLSFTLAPGQTRDVPVFGGTASCDPALGYMLPIGQYEARAMIDFSTRDGPLQEFWSDPLRLTVVAPPPS